MASVCKRRVVHAQLCVSGENRQLSLETKRSRLTTQLLSKLDRADSQGTRFHTATSCILAEKDE